MDIGSIKYRLTNDFQLAILTLFGGIALLGISPFTTLRAVNGEWVVFAVDLLIQVGTLGIVAYAWWSGDTNIPCIVLAYFLGISVVVAVYILGTVGMYWFYPAIVAIFFLVERRHALLIGLLSLAIAMFEIIIDTPTVYFFSFFTTVIVCVLVSYAFSYRTTMQRVQLETLVSKDQLTGLFNHRTLFEDLAGSRKTFEREKHSFGILILDLDHFKQVNDKYGHLIGDEILIGLARILQQQVRQSDKVFRFGGEEFVILIPGVDHKKLTLIAEKLRSKVDCDLLDPDGNSVTTSIGGAILRSDESSDEWFNRADTALYAAKDAGRNCVVIQSDD